MSLVQNSNYQRLFQFIEAIPQIPGEKEVQQAMNHLISNSKEMCDDFQALQEQINNGTAPEETQKKVSKLSNFLLGIQKPKEVEDPYEKVQKALVQTQECLTARKNNLHALAADQKEVIAASAIQLSRKPSQSASIKTDDEGNTNLHRLIYSGKATYESIREEIYKKGAEANPAALISAFNKEYITPFHAVLTLTIKEKVKIVNLFLNIFSFERLQPILNAHTPLLPELQNLTMEYIGNDCGERLTQTHYFSEPIKLVGTTINSRWSLFEYAQDEDYDVQRSVTEAAFRNVPLTDIQKERLNVIKQYRFSDALGRYLSVEALERFFIAEISQDAKISPFMLRDDAAIYVLSGFQYKNIHITTYTDIAQNHLSDIVEKFFKGSPASKICTPESVTYSIGLLRITFFKKTDFDDNLLFHERLKIALNGEGAIYPFSEDYQELSAHKEIRYDYPTPLAFDRQDKFKTWFWTKTLNGYDFLDHTDRFMDYSSFDGLGDESFSRIITKLFDNFSNFPELVLFNVLSKIGMQNRLIQVWNMVRNKLKILTTTIQFLQNNWDSETLILNIAKGIYLLEWMNGNPHVNAYEFTFSRPGKLRMYFSVKKNEEERFLRIEDLPEKIAEEFLSSWDSLVNGENRGSIYEDIPPSHFLPHIVKELGFDSLALIPENREAIGKLLANIEHPTVINQRRKKQFSAASTATAAAGK